MQNIKAAYRAYRLHSQLQSIHRSVSFQTSRQSRNMSSIADSRPIVGVVHNVSPKFADLLKEMRPELRIEFNLCGLQKWSDEEIRKLRSAQVIIADPFVIADYSQDLPNLQWMHSMYDGVDRITRHLDISKPVPQYTLTRNGGFFGYQMAEYVMGQVVSLERNFKAIWEDQKTKSWNQYYYRSMHELSMGIIGLGDIGKEVARLAKAFRMVVYAVVRTLPSNDQKCPHVDHYRLWSELPKMLSSCDYICTILPSTPSTDGLLDGNVLEPCKHKKSVFINIGRGNCIKNETILKALNEGWLSHAVLDVMEEEPLPASSPLWTHPNVTITPHLSGLCLYEPEFAKDFLKSYDRFVKGESLDYMVDWKKGY